MVRFFILTILFSHIFTLHNFLPRLILPKYLPVAIKVGSFIRNRYPLALNYKHVKEDRLVRLNQLTPEESRVNGCEWLSSVKQANEIKDEV